jgi:hypothetical protein
VLHEDGWHDMHVHARLRDDATGGPRDASGGRLGDARGG